MAVTLAELHVKREQQVKGLKALLDKESLSTEEFTQATSLRDEVKDLTTEIERLEALAAMKADTEKILGTYTTARSVVVPSGEGEKSVTGSETKSEKVYQVFNNEVSAFSGDDRAYKALVFGHSLLAMVAGNGRSALWLKDHAPALKAQTEGVNTAGGFVVTPEYTAEIINLMLAYGVARTLLRVRKMTRDTLHVPRRTTGVTAYHVGEGGTITESSKAWDRVSLSAKKIAALAKYSTELGEDAIIDIANDLAEEIAQAFAQQEDTDAFLGDGTSTYGGIVGVAGAFQKTVEDATGTWPTNYAYNPSIQIGSGNLFTEVVMADLVGMMAKVNQFKGKRAKNVWVCNSAFFFNAMVRLAMAQGGVTQEETTRPVDIDLETPRFMGYPVVFAQVLPATDANSQIACYFGDFKLAATFGDRREISLQLSDQRYLEEDNIGVRGTELFDVNVHDLGTAHATAASRVRGPVAALLTAAS